MKVSPHVPMPAPLEHLLQRSNSLYGAIEKVLSTATVADDPRASLAATLADIALEHGGSLMLLISKGHLNSALPLLAAFKDWVEKLLPGVPPTSALGKALSYTMNQWSKLVRFVEHPEVCRDNNYLENQIRPFAQGRRVWLFAQTQQGARARANLYSLVSCEGVNGLDPYAYLRYLFEEMPKARTAEAFEVLLPWNVRPALQAHGAPKPISGLHYSALGRHV